MGRTIFRRVHTGGLRTDIVQLSSSQGPRFVVELGWAPGPPWGAIFTDAQAALNAADAIIRREVHNCRERGCPDWQQLDTASNRVAVNE